MMVRAMTPFSLGGGRDVKVGEVFEMPDHEARLKVRMGWVEPAPADMPAPGGEREAGPVVSPGTITSAQPLVQNREPRRGR